MLNIDGQLMDLSTPKVMAILNLTPDSFFAGSRATEMEVLGRVEQFLTEGADLIDLGGYSSRPGADDIPVEAEIARTAAIIRLIKSEFPNSILSIDTFRSAVARRALDAGASLINDISGGQLDMDMLQLAGERKVPYIGMHMRGTPQTMRELTTYDDLLGEMTDYFLQLKSRAREVGIKDLILDPGFGFSKTLEHNYYLLNNLPRFKQLDCPILVGLSRKSMIFRLLEIGPSEALEGTIALNTVALLNGADILRVHDVKEAVHLRKLIGKLNDPGI